ncbi:hypothetical protein [Rothia mucilaginosa]|uniref:hypothetical protein n=1 Tax=Rothia mucilaginosa TaxID=43675 RepID=UPI0028EE7E2D|nr:hypothetical protein [Rothia mucilaginosa]
MNTWNIAADDLEFLRRHLEDLEAAGTPGFGLILTESIPFTFDSKKKTLWGEEIGTLEEILDWLESDPKPTQSAFCETISGGYRDSGEQLFTVPAQPVTGEVFVWWDDSGQESRTVFMDAGFADSEDLSDPAAEVWEDMERLAVHDAPLPVTTENVLTYAEHEVFTVNAPERIELIPARELLEELTEHFTH